MAAEQIIANGLELISPWCQVEDVSTMLAAAPRRGENVVVPGRHGVIRSPRKRYNPADIVIPMHVKGVDRATGAFVDDPVSQLHDNIDHLLRVFHAETVLLEYVRSDGTSRYADTELFGEPVEMVREKSSPPLARVSVALTLFNAFWRDAVSSSQTITGVDGTVQPLTAFEGASAPMQNLLITFTGPCNNPMLTHGTRWVKYNGAIAAGRQLMLNTETWQVSSGTGTPWTPDFRDLEFGEGATWLELDPSVTPFEITFNHTTGSSATCTVAGRKAYLTP